MEQARALNPALFAGNIQLHDMQQHQFGLGFAGKVSGSYEGRVRTARKRQRNENDFRRECGAVFVPSIVLALKGVQRLMAHMKFVTTRNKEWLGIRAGLSQDGFHTSILFVNLFPRRRTWLSRRSCRGDFGG